MSRKGTCRHVSKVACLLLLSPAHPAVPFSILWGKQTEVHSAFWLMLKWAKELFELILCSAEGITWQLSAEILPVVGAFVHIFAQELCTSTRSSHLHDGSLWQFAQALVQPAAQRLFVVQETLNFSFRLLCSFWKRAATHTKAPEDPTPWCSFFLFYFAGQRILLECTTANSNAMEKIKVPGICFCVSRIYCCTLDQSSSLLPPSHKQMFANYGEGGNRKYVLCKCRERNWAD